MKRASIVGLLLTVAIFAFAQTEIGAPDAEAFDLGAAQQKLRDVSIDRFENAGFWLSRMSSDEGYTTTRLFEGSPAGKVPLEGEEDIPDRYVLGTRVDFLRRGHSSFYIYPVRPIPIEGITKTISVWVVGRNYNHSLALVVQDFFGREFELQVGKLNFQGWKQLTVAIPPQSPDGRSGIVQRDYHYNTFMGIKFLGFKIYCDPLETYGSYYIYFDDLRARTDLYAEESRDPDDMNDGVW